jgi:hypothetical protein
MRSRITSWSRVSLIVLVAIAAWSLSYAADPEPEQVKATGTVVKVELEGSFWGIKANDGKSYDPLDSLPKEFRKDGLKVRFEATADKDAMSTHMWGTIVKITKIEEVKSSLIGAGNAHETKEKRELLANHETLAVFDGVEYRLCKGRTALCPKDCGDSGEFATFTVRKYLKYEKPGEYGDPKQVDFLVQISDYYKKPKGDASILKTVSGLKKGDYVLLSWHHDYVTKDGVSSPERPITKLEPIGREKAEGL